MSKYNIQIVSNLTGLSSHRIRAWENRYEAVVPERDKAGHRLYSQKDITKLKALRDLCALGMNIGNLAHKSIEDLNDQLKSLGAQTRSEENFSDINHDPEKSKRSLTHLMLALQAYKLDIVSHEFYNLKMTMSARDLALNVVAPLLGAVGQQVLDGRINIAQEHALSSIIKFHLGQFVYKSYEEKKISDDLIVFATPEKEFHEFGILLASLLCYHYQKNFFYLGPNMPVESLVESAKAIGATKIIIGATSATNTSSSTFLTEFIDQIMKSIGPQMQLIVGGSGFFDITKFQKKENFVYLPTLDHFDRFLKG